MPFSNPIVGGAGALIRPAIQSPDYAPGVSGWAINRDGTVEFASGTFRGDLTGEPVLSRLARKFDVEFNIRAGGVQSVGVTEIGTLVVDITGSDGDVAKALSYLEEEGVIVEETK